MKRNKGYNKITIFTKMKPQLRALMIDFKKIGLCFLYSILFTAIIFMAIYFVLDKDSWIVLNIFPEKYQLNSFTGDLAAKVYSVDIYDGHLTNRYPMKMTIEGKEYNLDSYELKINFAKDNHYNYLISKQPIRLTSVGQDINDVNILINNAADIISKDIHELSDYKNYTLSSDNRQNILFEIQKDTELTISGSISIYIKDELVASEGSYIINIEKRNDIDNYVGALVFDVSFNNMDIIISEDNIQTCYLDGKIKSFDGKASINSGRLLYTYLSEQKEFNIDFVDVKGESASEKLDCIYNFDSTSKNLLISGRVSDIEVADTNLYFNIKLFMKDNLAVIIGAIFTAFIATYIPNVLNKNK